MSIACGWVVARPDNAISGREKRAGSRLSRVAHRPGHVTCYKYKSYKTRNKLADSVAASIARDLLAII